MSSTDGRLDVPRLMRGVTVATLVVVILILLPFTYAPGLDGKYLALAGGVLVLSVMAAWRAWRGDSAPRLSLLGWLPALLLGLYALSAALSNHPGHSYTQLARLFLPMALFWLASLAYTRPAQVWRLIAFACAGVTLSSAYAMFQKAGLDPFPWALRDIDEYRGLPATFGNPNYAGHVLVLAVILCVGMIARKGSRLLGLALLPLMALHLHFTGMRAAAVALAAGAGLAAVAWLVARLVKDPRRAAVSTVVAVLLIGAAGAGAGALFFKARTGSFLPLDESLLLRYNSFLGAARMAVDRPVLGYGPGNYPIENPAYWTQFERARFAYKPQINVHVHNEYLEAAVEGGFPAAFLYMAFLFGAIIYSLHMFHVSTNPDKRRLALALAACFFAFTADGFFGFNLHLPVSAAIMFALAGAMEGVRRQEDAPAPGVSKTRFAATGLAALAVAAVALESASFAASHYYLKGLGARELKYDQEAKESFIQAAKLSPFDHRYCLEAGIEYFKEGKAPQQTLAWLGFARNRHPQNPDILARTGLAELACAVTAIANSPPRDPASPDEEWRQFVDGSLATPERWAHQAMNIVPMLPAAHELLAKCALTRNRAMPGADAAAWLADAVTHARIALANARDKHPLYTLMAEIQIARGDTQAAAGALRAAAQLEPAGNETWQVFERLAEQNGQWDEFTAALEEAVRAILTRPKEGQSPADAIDLMLMLADAQSRGAGRHAAALQTLGNALTLAPGRLDLWAAYADIVPAANPGKPLPEILADTVQTLRQKVEQAGNQIPPNLELVADIVNPLFFRGVANTPRLRKAVEEHAAAFGAEKTARDFGWLANLLSGASRALPQLQRGPVLYELAIAYLVMKDWPQAEAALAEAEPLLQPEMAVRARLARSEAVSQLGRYDEALQLATAAAAATPGAVEPQCQVARILARSGKTDEARAEYDRVMLLPGVTDQMRDRIQTEMKEAIAQAQAAQAQATQPPPGGVVP